MNNTSKTSIVASLAFAMSLAGTIAHADTPGRHPGFLHALTDLKSARWLIEHRPGDAAVTAHEDLAMQKIVAAISDCQRAAVDDGKGLSDHPPADAPASRKDRLLRARDLLTAAHHDVNEKEDDPKAVELKKVALKNIDEAYHELDGALWDLDHGK